MSDEIEFTDTDLANMARGFDAPPKQDLLEKLQDQALERHQERQQEQGRDELDEFFDRGNERENDELER